MEKNAGSLLRALEQTRDALSATAGGGGKHRWPAPRPGGIKELRDRLGCSQSEFALRYGFDLENLRNWEQGKRTPHQAACLLIRLIALEPTRLSEMIALVDMQAAAARAPVLET